MVDYNFETKCNFDEYSTAVSTDQPKTLCKSSKVYLKQRKINYSNGRKNFWI